MVKLYYYAQNHCTLNNGEKFLRTTKAKFKKGTKEQTSKQLLFLKVRRVILSMTSEMSNISLTNEEFD